MKSIGARVGRYEILGFIGRGGMASVYLARQADLDRRVALKELSLFEAADPEAARRFLREARLAGSFSDPNIVTVHDYFEDGGTPYIAMEYMERGSLRPYVGHMSLAQVGGVAEGVLGGLAHAEEVGVVHRDLKPENVMLTSQGRVKIADFGIAKATSSAQATANLTTAGTTLGTPRYMAPERAMGEDVGPWSDLYSVGVMMFELLVGRTPFYDTEEPMAVLLRQINDEIPPVSSLLPELDPAVSDWVGRLLVKDPAARTRAAATAWDELDEILMASLGARWLRGAALPALAGAALVMPEPLPPRLQTQAAATVAPSTLPFEPAAAPPVAAVPVAAAAAVAARPRRVGRLALVATLLIVAFAGASVAKDFLRPQPAGRNSAASESALRQLEREAAPHRLRLTAAETDADRSTAARALADDYDQAARRVERQDPSNDKQVAALDATARSYGQAAAAAARGDSSDFEDALAGAESRVTSSPGSSGDSSGDDSSSDSSGDDSSSDSSGDDSSSDSSGDDSSDDSSGDDSSDDDSSGDDGDSQSDDSSDDEDEPDEDDDGD